MTEIKDKNEKISSKKLSKEQNTQDLEILKSINTIINDSHQNLLQTMDDNGILLQSKKFLYDLDRFDLDNLLKSNADFLYSFLENNTIADKTKLDLLLQIYEKTLVEGKNSSFMKNYIEKIYKNIIKNEKLFEEILKKSYSDEKYYILFYDLVDCLDEKDIELILDFNIKNLFLNTLFYKDNKDLPIKVKISILKTLLPNKDINKLENIQSIFLENSDNLESFFISKDKNKSILYDLISIENGMISKNFSKDLQNKIVNNFDKDEENIIEKLQFLFYISKKDEYKLKIEEYLKQINKLEIDNTNFKSLFSLYDFILESKYKLDIKLEFDKIYEYILDNAFTNEDVFQSLISNSTFLSHFLYKLKNEDINVIIDSKYKNDFLINIKNTKIKNKGHLKILNYIHKSHKDLLDQGNEEYQLYTNTKNYVQDRAAYDGLLNNTKKDINLFKDIDEIIKDKQLLKYIIDMKLFDIFDNYNVDFIIFQTNDIEFDIKFKILTYLLEQNKINKDSFNGIKTKLVDDLFNNIENSNNKNIIINNLCVLLNEKEFDLLEKNNFLDIFLNILNSDKYTDKNKYDLILSFLGSNLYNQQTSEKIKEILSIINNFVCKICKKNNLGNTVQLKYKFLFNSKFYKTNEIDIDNSILVVMESFQSREIIEKLINEYLLKDDFLKILNDKNKFLKGLKNILKNRHTKYMTNEFISYLTNEYISKKALFTDFIKGDFKMIKDPLIKKIEEKIE